MNGMNHNDDAPEPRDKTSTTNGKTREHDDNGQNQSTPSDEPHAGFLHVIFHGLFCFFELENYILVRTPRIDEHSYLAGNWLGETGYAALPDYELMGVEPGASRFPRDRNLFIPGGVPAPNPPELYAEFRFPYPMQIDSVQLSPVSNASTLFDGGSKDRVKDVKNIATIQIFTYRFQNHLQLQLTGHEKWSADTSLTGNMATLHLWAEPDFVVDEDHVPHAFIESMKMFEAIDLTLTRSDDVPNMSADDIPYGTRVEEMRDLALRLKRLTQLGRAFKSGDDLRSTLVDDDGQNGGELLNGSDLQRCGHSVGGK